MCVQSPEHVLVCVCTVQSPLTHTYLLSLQVHVKGTVTASDQNEKELACIYLDFKA